MYIWQGSEYTMVSKYCHGSEYIRILNMSGFIKKMLHQIDAWQGCDYSSGSAYTKVLNMPGLHKVVKTLLHHRCLTGFQIFPRFWTCHDSKYARVAQNSEQNAPLEIFDRVVNMPLVLKWQGCRKFCVNCILEILGILNMPKVHNVPRFCIYQESWYARVSQGILKGFLTTSASEYVRVLNLLWKQP